MTAEPVLIKGALRDYEWGRHDGLARWSGSVTGGPQAELWYGCHPAAPSPVAEQPVTLVDLWGDRAAPLLVKLLAAGTPLSLQVHPVAGLAAEWLLDPEAADLLSDPEEKTELLVAVEPFVVLVGWRPSADAARILRAVGAADDVVAATAAGDPCGAVRRLLTDAPVHATPAAWARAIEAAGVDDVAVPAIASVIARFGDDPGVAVAAMLQSCRLEPGDAVYVPAGVPHAYVEGLGIEVMTSSDNVLRMGLTHKRMSVAHTLAAIVTDRSPTVIRAPLDHVYAPAGSPFEVVLVGPDDEPACPAASYRLALAVEGDAEVALEGRVVRVPEGMALAIPPNAGTARVTAHGRAVVVSSTQSAGEAA